MAGTTERYTYIPLCVDPIQRDPQKYRLAPEVWKSTIEHFCRQLLDLSDGRFLETRFWIEELDPVRIKFCRGGLTAGVADIRWLDGRPASLSLFLSKIDDRDDATAIAIARRLHPGLPEDLVAAVRRARRIHAPNTVHIAFDKQAYDHAGVQAASQSIGIAFARLLGLIRPGTAE
jgi:hypothetical protein